MSELFKAKHEQKNKYQDKLILDLEEVPLGFLDVKVVKLTLLVGAQQYQQDVKGQSY